MTKDEAISISRLAAKVDEMAREMITKDLLKSEIARLDQALNTHTEYTTAMAKIETDRLNAIRDVSDTAVRVAYNASLEQATLLAKQVETVASTLRDLVQTTAVATANNFFQTITPITARLDKLEAKQYEAQGKESVSDPALEAFFGKMDALEAKINDALSKGKGANMLWLYLVAILSVVSTAVGLLHILTP